MNCHSHPRQVTSSCLCEENTVKGERNELSLKEQFEVRKLSVTKMSHQILILQAHFTQHYNGVLHAGISAITDKIFQF